MPTPDISVIIPAYNHEAYIGPAIESVLNQTFADFELIIINDGSTDSTGSVMRGFSDRRIACYDQENQDAFNTINRGLGMAKGRFISILNSDDLYAPTRLERLRKECIETGAECVFTDVQPVDSEARPILDPVHGWNIWHQRNREHYFQCKDLYTGFLRGNFLVTTSNPSFPLARQKAARFASYRYLHDYDYMFRVLLACPGKVSYLKDERLISYRIHGSNTLSQGAILAREQDQRVIRQYMLEGIPEGGADGWQPALTGLLSLKSFSMRARLAGFPQATAPLREQVKFVARDLRRKLRARWPALAPLLGRK